MEIVVGVLSKLLTFTSLSSLSWNANNGGNAALRAKCLALKSGLTLESTTILDVSYLPVASGISTLGTCQSTATHAAPLCRVQFYTDTSDTSCIHAEAWLPDEWYGWFMGLGNRGLGGCTLFALSQDHLKLTPWHNRHSLRRAGLCVLPSFRHGCVQ